MFYQTLWNWRLERREKHLKHENKKRFNSKHTERESKSWDFSNVKAIFFTWIYILSITGKIFSKSGKKSSEEWKVCSMQKKLDSSCESDIIDYSSCTANASRGHLEAWMTTTNMQFSKRFLLANQRWLHQNSTWPTRKYTHFGYR